MMDDEYDRSSPFFFVVYVCIVIRMPSTPLSPLFLTLSPFFRFVVYGLVCFVVWCGVVWVVQSLN